MRKLKLPKIRLKKPMNERINKLMKKKLGAQTYIVTMCADGHHYTSTDGEPEHQGELLQEFMADAAANPESAKKILGKITKESEFKYYG